MSKKHALETYNLKYEYAKLPPINIKSNKIKKNQVQKRVDIRKFVSEKLQGLNKTFDNVVNKIKHPRKKARKLTKIEQEIAKNQRSRGILGIGQLLVVVSITYSTVVIFVGVDSSASRLALLPQVLFALTILFKAFSKLYK